MKDTITEDQKKFLKNQISLVVNETLRTEQEKEGEYKDFFKQMLDIFGVDGPDEIPEKHRDNFFTFVNNGWDSNKDTIDTSAIDKAKKYVKNKMEEQKVPSAFRRVVEHKINNGLTQEQAVREVMDFIKTKMK